MSIRYLIDENVDLLYKRQVLKKNSEVRVYAVGDPGCPPKSTLDPEILSWCEENLCILVTNNRASMPPHLAVHLEQGHHVPGILILNERMSIGDTIEELLLIAEVGIPSAYQDRVTHLPVT
jgi:hypothetical protein